MAVTISASAKNISYNTKLNAVSDLADNLDEKINEVNKHEKDLEKSLNHIKKIQRRDKWMMGRKRRRG